jgi:hypothetical protein
MSAGLLAAAMLCGPGSAFFGLKPGRVFSYDQTGPGLPRKVVRIVESSFIDEMPVLNVSTKIGTNKPIISYYQIDEEDQLWHVADEDKKLLKEPRLLARSVFLEKTDWRWTPKDSLGEYRLSSEYIIEHSCLGKKETKALVVTMNYTPKDNKGLATKEVWTYSEGIGLCTYLREVSAGDKLSRTTWELKSIEEPQL